MLVKRYMARKGRLHIPGGIYHIIIRGIERRFLFHDKKDRIRFSRCFSMCLEKTKVNCYARVLMTTHARFLLSPAQKLFICVTRSSASILIQKGESLIFGDEVKQVIRSASHPRI